MAKLSFSQNDFRKVKENFNFEWKDSLGTKVSERAQNAVKRYDKAASAAHASLDGLEKDVSYIFDRLSSIGIGLEFIR